ncbi:hypothetical protein N7523_003980 [Penicillium sp. IBT 18751x]|nr:hypothetical protein N7523_003980 [Penicillium sp. IBT 18751x]
MSSKTSRKRVKPSPGADSSSPTSPDNAARDRSDSQPQRPESWYPGNWSGISRVSKAAPVTEVARESISVAQNVASSVANTSASLLDSSKQYRNPSIKLTRKAGASTRSLPANVTTTRVNIVSDASASTTALDKLEEPAAPGTSTPKRETIEEETPKSIDRPKESQEVIPDKAGPAPEPNTSQADQTEQAGGWFSWLYRSGNTEKSTGSDPTPPETTETQPGQDEASKQTDTQPVTWDSPAQDQEQPQPDQESQPTSNTTEPASTAQKRSWLQMWYGSASSSKQGEQSTGDSSKASPAEPQTSLNEEVNMSPKDLSGEPDGSVDQTKPPPGNTRSSGWSFWSKESKDPSISQPQEVEGVEGTIDQSSPARETSLEPDPDTNVNITKNNSVKIKPPKDKYAKDRSASASAAAATSTSAPFAEPRPADLTASKQLQKILPNQVLPRFEDTYTLEEAPSILQSLGRILHYSKSPEHKHVSRIREPPRIKRALAIGVHGYFPAPLIRSVLGQPTGTSIRFSNMAAESIRQYTEDHGYSCDIEKIALEGEGRISERVDLLWKLLLNWMEEIRKADFIMLACHSQGVPVTIMLVAKLIAFGCVNASRVGICAMAGVNMGPFSAYRSRWISGSAGELFEFELPFSQVSKDYEASLKCCLDFGVRISYVGSIDDQLVSLESALFSPISHPYIYRSVFVDGRVHAPSFLSHLVGFALKLRNLGVQDHGLIRELSSPLAGSLYTGEGHSRLYDDEAVYYMAIQFALETTSLPNTNLHIKRSPPAIPNPYILPFAMRGILEEEHVRRELHEETMELLRQFDDWKPSSKVLKDVKFRLEGIRSKL